MRQTFQTPSEQFQRQWNQSFHPSQVSVTLPFAEFLSAPGVILDVRSPSEYAQGRIPGAISFPLFSDEERSQVGTCYKQQGRNAAVELGLALVSPKLLEFVHAAKALGADRHLRVHCWRGGMRSSSMGWLLETAGFQVALLQGGYKAFRHWVLATLEQPKPIVILGGMTGTGKTAILAALAEQGAQILDLEHWANHRGSSYGSLGLPPQPSTEQFENEIALQWIRFDPQQPVWIEAESRRIGLCRVPPALFDRMMQATVLEIQRSRSQRIALLKAEYGTADREELVAATDRLRNRLGGLCTQAAIDHIRQGNLAAAIDLVLDYYDKTYRYDLQKRNVPIHTVKVAGLDAADSATLLMAKAQHLLI